MAWAVQLALGHGLASHACSPQSTHLSTPIWSPLGPVLAAISAAVLLVGLAASWVALRNWRKVRHERPGSRHHWLEADEGRARFLAMWGLLTSCS
ncbi:hypothetical protein [Methylomagnum sp.]